MKIVIYNLGCKVNQYEADAIANELKNNGHEIIYEFALADVYIINTCAVTTEAERKSRQMVSKCLKFNPHAAIFVCGCASENNIEQFTDKRNVVYVGGTARKSLIPSMIQKITAEITENKIITDSIGDLPNEYEDNLSISNVRTRAYVKVQDGCNNYCSYCIIPYLRGRSRSRAIESVWEETHRLSNHVGEIVLTGINLSAYGTDIGSNLAALLEALADIDARIRLGSLEVNVITEEFLNATRKLKAFCPQFHLSLQSGDNDVLKSMNRHYTVGEYAERVALIRKFYPYAAITTDLIVAFPTETSVRFENTVTFIKSIGFADMHIFIYSPRSGTTAAKLTPIDSVTAKKREAIVKTAADDMRADYLSSLFGKVSEVLVENDGSGYSREYVRIYCGGNDGDIVTVIPKEFYKDGLR